MSDHLAGYRDHLLARHLAAATVRARVAMLEDYLAWLGTTDLRDASFDTVLEYRAHLARPAKANGEPNSIGYQNTQLRAVKSYYRWLADGGHVLVDPTKNLPPLKTPKKLPKGVPTAAQVMKLLRQPDLNTPEGFRDRAMFELLYSCGLRGLELCRLTLYDPDPETKTLRVLQGKGRKDRVVPVGSAALGYLREYLARVRPILAAGRPPGTILFLTRNGSPLRPDTLWRIVRHHRDAARLPKTLTTHSLRHACATEMLRGGASVRHVQEMLGHADISTTQIYTHLAKSDLQAVHRRTAPSERRKNTDAPAFELTNWRPRKRRPPRKPKLPNKRK